MLYHLADIRVVVWVCITLALMAVQWLGLVQNWTVYLLTFYFALACKVIVHNHCHFPTLKSGWNTLFSLLLEITTLTTVQVVYAIHMENHHRKHMTDDDCSGVHRYSGRWAFLEALHRPIFLFRQVSLERTVPSGDFWLDWARAVEGPRTSLAFNVYLFYCGDVAISSALGNADIFCCPECRVVMVDCDVKSSSAYWLLR